MRTIRFDLSIRTVLLILGLAAGVWLLMRLWPIVLLALTSLMLAAALMPVVDWLVRHRISRVLAILMLALTLLLVIGLIGLLVVPVVYEQVRSAIDRLPEARADAVQFFTDRGATRLAEGIEQFDPTEYIGPAIIDTGPQVLAALATVLTLLVLTAYILLDAQRLDRLLYTVAPASWHVHLHALLGGLQEAVGGYIRGQLTMSTIIFTFVLILFMVLRIPNPAAFAILAAIADCIPVVGVFFVVVPLAGAATTVALWKGIAVAIAMVAYTQLENQVLVQYVFSKALDMPAALVLLAVLCGGRLFGVAGALLSLPAAAALRVLLRYWLDLRARRVGVSAAVPQIQSVAVGDGHSPSPQPSPARGERAERGP